MGRVSIGWGSLTRGISGRVDGSKAMMKKSVGYHVSNKAPGQCWPGYQGLDPQQYWSSAGTWMGSGWEWTSKHGVMKFSNSPSKCGGFYRCGIMKVNRFPWDISAMLLTWDFHDENAKVIPPKKCENFTRQQDWESAGTARRSTEFMCSQPIFGNVTNLWWILIATPKDRHIKSDLNRGW